MSKTCCQCQAIERMFDAREAQRELERYRRKGPAKTTRLLVRAIAAQGLDGTTAATAGEASSATTDGATLLDIGGGIGAIQLGLLAEGVSSTTDVDASQAYLDTARQEAEREGYGERVTYVHGNFVDLAPTLAPADIVTLERVICCFPDMHALVGASAGKARRLYGLVYPRDTWWMRLGARLINATMWLQRSAFRFSVHSQAAIEAELRRQGLAWRYATTAGPWQVALYARSAASADH